MISCCKVSYEYERIPKKIGSLQRNKTPSFIPKDKSNFPTGYSKIKKKEKFIILQKEYPAL